ncbi:hypothetical protein CAMGR0001_1767 [Campylobacter gracilis RM3268]|uniref:Uncharacterized protein n=1 Tax=Campylobacter gracilis RM3268 TaxID=553220 RepID=C8PK62_9BACT|nr:hypothetical protein CAMGR0001_1767 [Campylobacter gracilis RM3268]
MHLFSFKSKLISVLKLYSFTYKEGLNIRFKFRLHAGLGKVKF